MLRGGACIEEAKRPRERCFTNGLAQNRPESFAYCQKKYNFRQWLPANSHRFHIGDIWQRGAAAYRDKIVSVAQNNYEGFGLS